MFQIGEYMQYGSNGVCKVHDITQNVAGFAKGKTYYVLIPINNTASRIYTPVDNRKVLMRKLLTPDEVERLLKRIPNIPELRISDNKARESKYKEAILSGNSERWVQVMKTVCLRQQRRMEQGKKIAAIDERYLKSAEDKLCGELAVTLGKEKDQMKEYLREQMSQMIHISKGI